MDEEDRGGAADGFVRREEDVTPALDESADASAAALPAADTTESGDAVDPGDAGHAGHAGDAYLSPATGEIEEGGVAVATETVGPSPVVAAGDDSRTPLPGPRRRGLAIIGYVAAAVLGAVLVAALFVGSGAATFGPTPSPAPTFSAEGATVGYPGSPVTIEVWADYQCPYCGLFTHGIEPTLFRDYAATGRAVVSFRDYAFLGQESIDAAVAARCAGRQGKFWTYHDLLYASQNGENQGAFRRANLDALADFAALDKAAFDACLSDASVARAVADEKDAGDGYGISSTPTVRITGPGGTKLLKGVAQPSAIAAAVEAVATARPSGSPGASGTGGNPGASATTDTSSGGSSSGGAPSAGPAGSPASSASPSVSPSGG